MGKKTKNTKKNKFIASGEVDNDVSNNKVVAKKAQKNKMIETSVENNNESELSGPKPKKAKKNKLAEAPAQVATVNNVSVNKLAKKGKKNKITETSVGADGNESELITPKAKKAKKNKLVLKSTEESSEDEEELPESSDDEKSSEDGKEDPESLDDEKSSEDGKEDPEMSDDESKSSKINIKKAKQKKNKQNDKGDGAVTAKPVQQNKFLQFKQGVTEEMIARYPILNDEALADQYMAVKLTSSQKGRMRQVFKSSLQGTPEALLPDVIHSRMKIILKSPTLTETALRKLRILYGMLKTSLLNEKPGEKKSVNKVENKSKDGEHTEQKSKGPKRWVVFIGNLPKGIAKEKIIEHFSDLGDNIKDVRLPKKSTEPKSAIAYLEVTDNLNFELALSKHHTMLENRRINVLYTAQTGTKLSKTDAKGKAAKLVALQKSGKLAGSIPLSKKRSARRNKMKEAKKMDAE